LFVYKAVKQRIETGPFLLTFMGTFLLMMNDCLRLGLGSDNLSYQEIKSLCYPRMMEYEVENCYRVSAMYVASNLLKRYRNAEDQEHPSKPYCRRPFFSASLDVRLEGHELVMPGNIRLALNAHTLFVLRQKGVELVSATLVPGSLSVIYRKNVQPLQTAGAVALDTNLRNIASYDTEGREERYDIGELVRIQEQYRRITSKFRRNDLRVRRRLFQKHAAIARERRLRLLHGLSSFVVYRAAALRQTIVMEDLRGIRALFGKESGSSASYLAMMNAWPFAELQRQIGYKAKWEGLPVVYVEPAGTSNECSGCGAAMRESPGDYPLLTCKACGLVIDRDLNAAKNILSRSLRSGDVGSANEAMVGRVSQEGETAATVDADHLFGRSEDRTEGSEYC
jgi:putative transposase